MFRTFWKFVGVAVMALAVSAPVSHAKQRLLMGTSTGGLLLRSRRHMEQRAERQARRQGGSLHRSDRRS
ncbi:MAG: hypothetical protein ACLRWP_09255 [Bilophila wadsworthia]